MNDNFLHSCHIHNKMLRATYLFILLLPFVDTKGRDDEDDEDDGEDECGDIREDLRSLPRRFGIICLIKTVRV